MIFSFCYYCHCYSFTGKYFLETITHCLYIYCMYSYVINNVIICINQNISKA